MGIRETMAEASGKLVHWGLHDVLHRSASQLPGRVALTIDPQVLTALRNKLARGSIVVCGTNGKTTTTNIIAASIEASGRTVLCNREGANMAAGVTTALLEGHAADWAVLEADELSTIHILPQLQPRYLVLLNLFRDQLDRAGELDHIQDVLVASLASSPHTTLIVCGDDPLSWGVALRARSAGTHVVTFGIAEDTGQPADRVPEARFCQLCGEELVYEYHAYAQLGKFGCPTCDFARPKLDVRAKDVCVTDQGVTMRASQGDDAEGTKIRAGFGGIYMAYNLLAAWAVASRADVSASDFGRALDGYDPHNGRLQKFEVCGREVVLNLAKNPTGLNQNISLLLLDERPKVVYVIVNDDYNDGRDISWIWDVDFERLQSTNVIRVLAGGHRANDVQVRLKYAGLGVAIAGSVAEALARVGDISTASPLFVLANYSALWPAKAELEGMCSHGD